MTEKKPIIAYYRVSTKKQGASGLGLDVQKSMIEKYLEAKPDYEYTEIETGTAKRYRPILMAAMDKCEALNGRLVVAKLDRLSRNLFFVAGLIEKRIDFVSVDTPFATPVMIQMQAVFAEYEAKMISERTKAGLKALVERRRLTNPEFKLGNFKNLPCLKRQRMKLMELAQQNPNIERAIPHIIDMRKSGSTLVEISKYLNQIGIRSPMGCLWMPQSVNNVLRRYNEIENEGFEKEFEYRDKGGEVKENQKVA